MAKKKSKEFYVCPKCGSDNVFLGDGGVMRVPDTMLVNDPEWVCKDCNHVASIFPIKVERKKGGKK